MIVQGNCFPANSAAPTACAFLDQEILSAVRATCLEYGFDGSHEYEPNRSRATLRQLMAPIAILGAVPDEIKRGNLGAVRQLVERIVFNTKANSGLGSEVGQ